MLIASVRKVGQIKTRRNVNPAHPRAKLRSRKSTFPKSGKTTFPIANNVAMLAVGKEVHTSLTDTQIVASKTRIKDPEAIHNRR